MSSTVHTNMSLSRMPRAAWLARWCALRGSVAMLALAALLIASATGVAAAAAADDAEARPFAARVDLTQCDVAREGMVLAPGRYVRITVSDTGGGIPPDAIGNSQSPAMSTPARPPTHHTITNRPPSCWGRDVSCQRGIPTL